MNKKTLIIGASTNPERYSYKAAHMLSQYGHSIINVGIKKGEVAGQPIEPATTIYDDIDTVTMYMGAQNQKPLYDYILELHPKRIIFNPGAENTELQLLAESNGITVENACTLVLLRTGQY
ncbi:CoA-binding protein [Sphingobacterium sp. SYP-B4668]|uniref:CoA-binding protein n=1 Tax=Sphingobacterium sp. SYP-B4668 TaxID=2996035 RepID=UPI0022DD4172|nr:CoA-binding protein [Sphingobacterium sp. SYP-B4668]